MLDKRWLSNQRDCQARRGNTIEDNASIINLPLGFVIASIVHTQMCMLNYGGAYPFATYALHHVYQFQYM